MNKFCVFTLAIICWSPLQAFEDSALWLPVSYQKLKPELRQAAKKMESMDSCQKVLRGYLHDSSTSLEDAVFMIVCRAPDRKTHSVLVDANSLEVEYPLAVDTEKQYVGVDLQARVDKVWKACQAQYKTKTKFMRNLKTLTTSQPDPEVGEAGAVTLSIDFDAESLQGSPLRYRAKCHSPDDKTPAKLSIVARK
ncbi:MAG: hypothetical protein ACRBBW_00780 [Cellvibrionaceae bacterium]